MIAVGAEPVFQDETSHAMLVKPERVIVALVRRQSHIAAAGTNHHRRAGGTALALQAVGSRVAVFQTARCRGVPLFWRVRSVVFVTSGRYGVSVGMSLEFVPSAPGTPPGQSGMAAAFPLGTKRVTKAKLPS